MATRPSPTPTDRLSEHDPAGVRFIDRRAGQCAWPLWGENVHLDDKRCCGRSVPIERTYCAQHRARGTSRGTPSEGTADQPLLTRSAKETLTCVSEK